MTVLEFLMKSLEPQTLAQIAKACGSGDDLLGQLDALRESGRIKASKRSPTRYTVSDLFACRLMLATISARLDAMEAEEQIERSR